MTQFLAVRSVYRSFGGLHAVHDVSFDVEEGSITAVIGPNGAGKSTLFNVISGTLAPSSGTVVFRGMRISGLRPHRVAAMGMARTFQTTKLFPHMTVLENVMIGRHLHSTTGFLGAMLWLPGARREEDRIRREAAETLEFFGLLEFANEPAGTLSFGIQRRIEFARAHATEPRILLLDEPAAGLNITETSALSKLIIRIREWGATILVVEHDMSLVMGISDRVVVLNQGEKLTEGTPREVQRDPRVIQTYLGEADAPDS